MVGILSYGLVDRQTTHPSVGLFLALFMDIMTER